MTRGHVYRDEADFDDDLVHPSLIKRQARLRRLPDPAGSPRRSRPRHVSDADDTLLSDDDMPMTYKPARFERVWLLDSLRPFYEQELIVDVLALVKGGKEANVYCCRTHPGGPRPLLAAKVYRPRQFRNLSNDALYREGRTILTPEGAPVKGTQDRIVRAIGKKTPMGVQVEHTSWLMYEYTALERLHRAGGAVPQPLAAGPNALLMSYHGDVGEPAPTLNGVGLAPDEVAPLFDEVLRNVDLMLQHGLVHGDLSAYNILYWEGSITLIDFPQVVDIIGNLSAYAILRRDLTRVCQYFARQGLARDPVALAADLWQRYGPEDAEELEAGM